MGYLGLVGGQNPCGAGALAPNISDDMTDVLSFQDSPFGFTFDFGGSNLLIPYEIDPLTLDIELRPDLAITGAPGFVQGGIVMDDSTVIVGATSGSSHGFYAITRSGGIAISGPGFPQQVVTMQSGSSASWCRIDSTHIVRAHTPAGGVANRRVVETFSVSGGALSIVSMNTLLPSPVQTATADPGGGGFNISTVIFPFHYNAGRLFAFGSAIVGFQQILSIAYTPGGGIGGTGQLTTANTRAKDGQNVGGALTRGAKIGSSECLLRAVGNVMPFYDDGAHMHFDNVNASAWFNASTLQHNSVQDQETTQPSYLTNNVTRMPTSGSLINSGPALISQSGTSVSYATITPQFKCPQFGTALTPGDARHGANLGAQIIPDPFLSGGSLIRAFRW